MTVTVFTPTYNRADLLYRLYKSLCGQVFTDFEWVIVDDGSKDKTEDVIKSFIEEECLNIHYIKQTNGGKHRAINRGLKAAKGELFFIADSDDYLHKSSLLNVVTEYNKIRQDKQIAGIAGLDEKTCGGIIGSGLPYDMIVCNALDIRYRYNVKGDLKEVFRTEVLKEIPFPEYEGEKFCPEALVWNRIAKRYKLLYINKPIYIVEYQENGITSSIIKARMLSPLASITYYAELNCSNIPLAQKVKAAINYWRFRFCMANGVEKPILPWYWNWTAIAGWIMHINDIYKIKE